MSRGNDGRGGIIDDEGADCDCPVDVWGREKSVDDGAEKRKVTTNDWDGVEEARAIYRDDRRARASGVFSVETRTVNARGPVVVMVVVDE